MERLKAEAIELRFAARRYDEIQDDLPVWRAKAERHDRLLAELKAIRARAAVALVVLEQWLLLYLVVSREQRSTATAPASSRARRHVCILSCRDLRHGMRVPAMAQALVDAGCMVTVVCRHPPARPPQQEAGPVEYLTVSLSPRATPPGEKATAHGRRGKPDTASFPSTCLLSAGRHLLSAPRTLLLRMAKRRFGAAHDVDTAGKTAGAAVTLPSHRWVRSHTFAEAVDIATRGRHFDVVQAHGAGALVAAARLAARDHAKLLCDAIAPPYHPPTDRPGAFEMLCRRRENHEMSAILRGAGIVIATGDELADEHARAYGIDRPLVIRDCPSYWPYRVNRRLRVDCVLGVMDRLVVWCGPACRQGEIKRLIEAAALMSPDIHVAIVATAVPTPPADFAQRLTEYAAERGGAGRVHVPPAPEPADLVPYLSGADLGVSLGMSTYATAFQNILMARLPIAVAGGGDVAALVRKHDIGEVFAGSDPKDIAATVERMLEPTAYRRLRQNTMTLAEDMTWEAESIAYLAAIRALTPTPAAAEPSRACGPPLGVSRSRNAAPDGIGSVAHNKKPSHGDP
ncbi:MAG TPA: hypothetical protein VGF34_01395 [Stellaceae bacterium]